MCEKCDICSACQNELDELRAFKKKHDEQLMKCFGSVTHKQLMGEVVLGCHINSFKQNEKIH